MKIKDWTLINLGNETAGVAITLFDEKKNYDLLISNIKNNIRLKKIAEEKSSEIEEEELNYTIAKVYNDHRKQIDFRIVNGNLEIYFGDYTLFLLDYEKNNLKNKIKQLSLSIGHQSKVILGINPFTTLDHIIIKGIIKK